MFKAKLKEGIKSSLVKMADGVTFRINKERIVELPKKYYEEMENGKNFIIISEPPIDEVVEQEEPPIDEVVEMEEVKTNGKSGRGRPKKTTEMD